MNTINLSIDEKEKYLDLLGSKEFPKILKSYNLNYSLYNKLFACHILAIGFQTSGIQDGSISLSYIQKFDSSFETPKILNFSPLIEFSFVTRNNSLIQTSKYHTTRSRIQIHNKKNSYRINKPHSYSNNEYSNPLEFHEFLTEYIKLDSLSDIDHNTRLNKSTLEKEEDNAKFKFRIYGKTKKEKIELAFQQIIFNNLETNSFLSYHFFKHSLIEKPINQNKSKI